MPDKVRLAIVGSGNMAKKHLEVLSSFPDVELAAISNRGGPGIQETAKQFGISKVYSDYRKMLDDQKHDAVLITVGILDTVEVTQECLRRKISSLIEKPPGLSSEECKSLAHLAKAGNVINIVALNRRFYSTMQKARDYILKKGPLVSVTVEAPEKFELVKKMHPPHIQNRWFFANGIHCIDLMRFFGGDVADVKSISQRWFSEQNDSFSALLKFRSGATGTYISHWTSPGRWSVNLYGQKCRVNIAPLEQGIFIDQDGVETLIEVDEKDRSFKTGLFAQDQYFVNCVKSGCQSSFPASDLEDAVKSLELAESILQGTGV
jgi:predicted dehydrogenase